MNKLFVFFQQSSFVDVTGKCYAHGYSIVFQDENREYCYPLDTSEELLEYNTPEKILALIEGTEYLNNKFWHVIKGANGFFFGPAQKWYSYKWDCLAV